MISKYEDVTEVKYDQEGNTITTFLSNMTNIDSIHVSNISSDIRSYLHYDITVFNKRIIKSIVMSIDNFMEININIDYKEFAKIMIPERIIASSKMSGNNQQINFTFKNIVLK